MSRRTNGRKARADLEFVQETLSLLPLSLSQYLGSMLWPKGPTEMLWLLLNLPPCAGEVTPCPPGLRDGELTWGEEGALV